jgi:geranylgeranyl diphosphate synthase type II
MKSLERELLNQTRTLNGKLADSVRYSLLAPGKRLRPRLLIETGQLLGLRPASLLPSAAALEMIHCFSLIHDDLPCMDDDDMRRGRPSNHKAFGEDVALLAGDALYGMAAEAVLATPGISARLTLAALAELLEASRGMIQGQSAELDQLNSVPSLASLEKIHALKTGKLFEASIRMPLALAGVGPSKASHKMLSRLAKTIGRSFQIQDDLEDPRDTSVADPKNILYFEKEPRTLAAKTLKELTRAMEAVGKHYKGHANPLLSELVPLCDALATQALEPYET